MSSSSAPTIESIVWGSIKIDHNGEKLSFKDAKVGPSGASSWDWRVTGTAHEPGIQVGDIQEFIDNKVDEIILSRGMKMVLKVHPDTIAYLKQHNISFFEDQTEKAVKHYNECVASGKKVGGVFHSTC